jgi:DUF218 domain
MEEIHMLIRTVTTLLVGSYLMYASASHATREVSSISPEAEPLLIEDGVRDKNFYLCRLLDSPTAAEVLRADPKLRQLTTAYRSRLVESLQTCSLNAACYINGARLSDADVESQVSALGDLFDREPSVRDVAEKLRRSGIMVRSGSESNKKLLTDAWRSSANSVNHILATYGDGIAPGMGEIDAMSQDPHSEAFGVQIRTATRVVLATDVMRKSFWSDPVQFAVLVLGINGRDEAGRFEPLEKGENALAVQQMSHTSWSGYRYSAIVVLGNGPTDPAVRLSGLGLLHLEFAVARYREGAAPFILVSGGFVHPPRTQFNEALEMKRTLIERYHVPAASIVVDPHARHTTTNFRNAVRLLYRYRVPFEMKALAVADEYQVDQIMSEAFDERNLRQTDTLPYLSKSRISPAEVEFVPSVDALQVNWEDPLDP